MTYQEFEKEYLHNRTVDISYYDYKKLEKIFGSEWYNGAPEYFYSKEGEPLYISVINQSEAETIKFNTNEYVRYIEEIDLYFWFQYRTTYSEIELKGKE